MQTKLKLLSVILTLLAAVPAEAVKVYKSKTEGLADVKVYVTSSEGLADCLIHVVSSEGLADGNAKWYYVNSEGLADIKVYFVSSEGLADKKVYFTKSEGLARCDVDWKGYKRSMADQEFGSFEALRFSAGALIQVLFWSRSAARGSREFSRLLRRLSLLTSTYDFGIAACET